MLEAKYFRDYKHNYMILQCGQEAVARSYQYKILTSEKIREILKCSVRHINGVTYYYYDISSRTTLKNLYQSTKMSYDQVKDLLWQLHGICDKLAGFFMEEACLVLLPEHIYYDFSTQRYIGLYYPDYKTAGVAAYEPLMNFLLEHIDTEDRQLTENLYRIYEMAGETHFVLEDALQILEEKNEPEPELPPPGNPEPFGIVEELPPVEPLQEEKEKPKRSLFYPVTAILSALGGAGAAGVYAMYDLVQEEEIALYGIMAALGVCFLFSLWGSFHTTRKGRTAESGTKDKKAVEPFADLPDGDAFSLDNVISKDMSRDVMCHPAEKERMIQTGADLKEKEPDYYGNTVFFDSRQAEYKLYAVDRRNKQHIELRKFPFTIGKMAGCVDYVLADNSVSRIHAKFDRQGDKVLLTDMNSTNGTYKNGLRMQPQETVEIEPGDEIRFGSLNYCYR